MKRLTIAELRERLDDAKADASLLFEYVWQLHQNAQPDASTTVALPYGWAQLVVVGHKRYFGGVVVVRYHEPSIGGRVPPFAVEKWVRWAHRIRAEGSPAWVKAIERLEAQLREPEGAVVPLLDWLKSNGVPS